MKGTRPLDNAEIRKVSEAFGGDIFRSESESIYVRRIRRWTDLAN